MPDAELLTRYDDLIPNGADRIMKLLEIQTQHRIGLEDFAVKEQIKQSGIGQYLGFFIVLIIMALSAYCIYLKESGYGISLVIGAIATLLYVFRGGKLEQKKSLENKKPQ